MFLSLSGVNKNPTTHYYFQNQLISASMISLQTVPTTSYNLIIATEDINGISIKWLFVFRELSPLAKYKVREKTTPRQFVKNKVRERLSDLGYINICKPSPPILNY